MTKATRKIKTTDPAPAGGPSVPRSAVCHIALKISALTESAKRFAEEPRAYLDDLWTILDLLEEQADALKKLSE